MILVIVRLILRIRPTSRLEARAATGIGQQIPGRLSNSPFSIASSIFSSMILSKATQINLRESGIIILPIRPIGYDPLAEQE